MITVTARTQDQPQPTATVDGEPIIYLLEPGRYAFAELSDGRVAVVRKTADAQPSRNWAAEVNEANRRHWQQPPR